jgi:hypothetical protein
MGNNAAVLFGLKSFYGREWFQASNGAFGAGDRKEPGARALAGVRSQ